ncbi:MAG: hypothetical protein KAG92_06275 [Deltaproteobacteria bacterium]|nr:hypothetical protein [Deltaproteobacteria bacterium]
MALHRELNTSDIHTSYRWIVADATERAAVALNPDDSAITAEDGLHTKLLQLDTKAEYLCTAISPVTFTAIGGGGGEDNVQADWDEASSSYDAFILNKPTTITTAQSDTLADLDAINTANGFDLQDPDSMGTPSWDNANRQYKLTPKTGESNFSYRVDGDLHEHTALATSEVMPDVTGTYYFYFDDTETLKVINEDSITLDVFYKYAIAGLVYYNATTSIGRPSEERHGYRMASSDHEMEHMTMGARHAGGLALTGLVDGQTTFTGMTSGKIYDEDIPHIIAAQATLPFMYREGADGAWVWTAANNNVGFKNSGTYVVWNEWDGSVWGLSPGTVLTDYTLVFTVAMKTLTGYSDGSKIIGQEAFSSAAKARAAVEAAKKKLVLDGLPSPELVFVGVHIAKRNGNLVVLEDGSPYLDLRGTSSRGSGSPSSSNLASDIVVDAGAFAGALSSTDTDVQTALGTLDTHDHDGVYAPALGANDNYVTDAEKTVIGNTSNTNTGDQDISGLMSDIVDDTTPQLGGNLDINGKAITHIFEAGVALSAGDVCFMDANGRMQKTDADYENLSKGFVCICGAGVAAYSSASFILYGVITGFTGLTRGGVCYLSTSSGYFTQVRPTTVGDYVRVIGYAISATSIFFQPSPVWAKI